MYDSSAVEVLKCARLDDDPTEYLGLIIVPVLLLTLRTARTDRRGRVSIMCAHSIHP